MQFKVPQNIDMQDKIIGPLTLSQFFYLLFGGLIIYILFNKLVLNGLGFIFFVLAIPIGLFSFALAFIKVQDQPFPSFVTALIKYLQTPRARIWQHYSPPAKLQNPNPKSQKEKIAKPKKQLDSVRVQELSTILDAPPQNNNQVPNTK